jgi:hypothetical protein
MAIYGTLVNPGGLRIRVEVLSKNFAVINPEWHLSPNKKAGSVNVSYLDENAKVVVVNWVPITAETIVNQHGDIQSLSYVEIEEADYNSLPECGLDPSENPPYGVYSC